MKSDGTFCDFWPVREKLAANKSLGQHFLTDENVAARIVNSFLELNDCQTIVEVGPGTGVLTRYLLERKSGRQFFAVDADARMIAHLINSFPQERASFILHDFLSLDLKSITATEVGVIGNFPYNISSQILFKVLAQKAMLPLVVGMFQKEVARRIASPHNSKEYGILSVLLQAFYRVNYLFEVHERCFAPAPKVKSAVVSLEKLQAPVVLLDEKKFVQLVKAGFNQRRKTLRNSLRAFLSPDELKQEIYSKRAEQLSVSEWIHLSNKIAETRWPQPKKY